LDNIIKLKLDAVFRECDAHLSKLSRSSSMLTPLFPLTVQSLKELPEESITLLDQFLYRFIKLQDSMGTRLIPVIAGLVSGSDDPRPFIDSLNILEKNLIIESAEKWQELRNIRNRLAHEYPDSADITVSSLNRLIAEWREMENMYLSTKRYYAERLS